MSNIRSFLPKKNLFYERQKSTCCSKSQKNLDKIETKLHRIQFHSKRGAAIVYLLCSINLVIVYQEDKIKYESENTSQ